MMTQKMPDFMLTPSDIGEQLRHAGWHAGMTVLVHSSMSRIGGWIPSGTQTIITAMLDVIGEDGTLVMPTMTTDNSEPSYWQNPPIPESWWPTMRDVMPAFDPDTSPTRMMGILAENFRSYPQVRRSQHPQASFAAHGKHAGFITANHDLEQQFGEKSPLARIYELDGYVFLLGVGYGNNTSLHLAEERMDSPRHAPQGSAMLVDGKRQWVTFDTVDYEDDDFETIGADYETAHPEAVQVSTVGNATVRLMRQRPLVDFGVTWLNKHRPKNSPLS